MLALDLPPLVLPPLRPELAKMRTRVLKEPSELLQQQRMALAMNPTLAWTKGDLWYKLDGNQLRAYRLIRAAMEKPFAQFILNWARRTGKTFILCLIAVEDAIRATRRRFNIAAVTRNSLAQFIWPMFISMLQDCPHNLRPWMDMNGGRIEFRRHAASREDASVIQMAGCDDAAAVERLRGPYSNGNVIEEMGTIPDNPGLRYILTSILNPQTKSTGGWTLGAMTPPRSSGHASAAFCLIAEQQGNYDYCTTFDCPRYSDKEHWDYIATDAKLLGITVAEYLETVEFKREWLALIETDPTLAVMPAWNKERKAKVVCDAQDTPIFVDRYTSMDIGFSPDWTGLLYAYWSFERRKLRIVGERLIRRMGTTELVEAIREDEKRFFGYEPGNGGDKRTKGHPPFLRVADNNAPILLRDLALDHDLLFVETKKDHLRAAVLDVNRWLGVENMIEIDPGCKNLVVQLTAATWNTRGTEFSKSAEYGHFDLVASLVYLVRNVIPNIDRVPQHYGIPRDHNVVNSLDYSEPQDAVLQSLFTLPDSN